VPRWPRPGPAHAAGLPRGTLTPQGCPGNANAAPGRVRSGRCPARRDEIYLFAGTGYGKDFSGPRPFSLCLCNTRIAISPNPHARQIRVAPMNDGADQAFRDFATAVSGVAPAGAGGRRRLIPKRGEAADTDTIARLGRAPAVTLVAATGGHQAPPGTAGTRRPGPQRCPATNDASNVRRPPERSYDTIRSRRNAATTITTRPIPPNRRERSNDRRALTGRSDLPVLDAQSGTSRGYPRSDNVLAWLGEPKSPR